jgi:acyl carrier protein phosphodiesterase
MNHLAHALLAAPDDDCMLGSLIADAVRGGIDPALPRGVRIGIALHRSVDVFTDAHAQVVDARALFEPPYRRYAGILLDIWFDHLLARDWAVYAGDPLHAFSQRVQQLLRTRVAELPTRMHGLARYMQANDLPEAYADVAMIERVLRGMSQRVSRTNPMADALPVLQALAAPLDRHFAAFFPDLVGHAARERVRLAAMLPG